MMLTCLLSKKLAKYLYGDKKFVIAASCSLSDDYFANISFYVGAAICP